MNHKGPEGEGPMTGRKLGLCTGNRAKENMLFGKGMGKRRKAGDGEGLGKRFKSNEIQNNH